MENLKYASQSPLKTHMGFPTHMEFMSDGCDMLWEHGAPLPQSKSLGVEG